MAGAVRHLNSNLEKTLTGIQAESAKNFTLLQKQMKTGNANLQTIIIESRDENNSKFEYLDEKFQNFTSEILARLFTFQTQTVLDLSNLKNTIETQKTQNDFLFKIILLQTFILACFLFLSILVCLVFCCCQCRKKEKTNKVVEKIEVTHRKSMTQEGEAAEGEQAEQETQF